jgi:hypothetical protein
VPAVAKFLNENLHNAFHAWFHLAEVPGITEFLQARLDDPGLSEFDRHGVTCLLGRLRNLDRQVTEFQSLYDPAEDFDPPQDVMDQFEKMNPGKPVFETVDGKKRLSYPLARALLLVHVSVDIEQLHAFQDRLAYGVPSNVKPEDLN